MQRNHLTCCTLVSDLRVNINVNHGLWMVLLCHCRLISKKHVHLVGVLAMGEPLSIYLALYHKSLLCSALANSPVTTIFLFYFFFHFHSLCHQGRKEQRLCVVLQVVLKVSEVCVYAFSI